MTNRSESFKSSGTESLSLSAESQTQNWFIKYKIYHLPFWYLYHYLWTAVNSRQPIEVLSFIFSSPKFLLYVIFQACAVYFNLYFLIPRYLEKGKYYSYVIYLVLTILAAASIIVSGYYWSAYLNDSTTLKLYGHEDFSHFFLTYTMPSTLTSMMLAMSIKLAKNWIQSRRKQRELEKENLETELKFLKSQMNPHFLFNTINSIFVLIHKNPMMASESLAKFSELLRYQLYECNEQQIPLGQELNYLGNFIELQELREDHDRITLQVNIAPYATGNYMIAPFVLIPFIENAFKHVSRRNDQSNWIKINLQIENQLLNFSIANSISSTFHSATEAVKQGGIGLTNVKRRLDLVYPDKHQLSVQHHKDHFEVTLQLELMESSVPERTMISA